MTDSKTMAVSLVRIERKRARARAYHARHVDRINKLRREKYARDMERVREQE